MQYRFYETTTNVNITAITLNASRMKKLSLRRLSSAGSLCHFTSEDPEKMPTISPSSARVGSPTTFISDTKLPAPSTVPSHCSTNFRPISDSQQLASCMQMQKWRRRTRPSQQRRQPVNSLYHSPRCTMRQGQRMTSVLKPTQALSRKKKSTRRMMRTVDQERTLQLGKTVWCSIQSRDSFSQKPSSWAGLVPSTSSTLTSFINQIEFHLLQAQPGLRLPSFEKSLPRVVGCCHSPAGLAQPQPYFRSGLNLPASLGSGQSFVPPKRSARCGLSLLLKPNSLDLLWKLKVSWWRGWTLLNLSLLLDISFILSLSQDTILSRRNLLSFDHCLTICSHCPLFCPFYFYFYFYIPCLSCCLSCSLSCPFSCCLSCPLSYPLPCPFFRPLYQFFSCPFSCPLPYTFSIFRSTFSDFQLLSNGPERLL